MIICPKCDGEMIVTKFLFDDDKTEIIGAIVTCEGCSHVISSEKA